MRITASKLREDVYNILDRVLELGEPLEVARHGKVLKIVPEGTRAGRTRGKKRRRAMTGDPEEYVHIDWLPRRSEVLLWRSARGKFIGG